MEDYTYVEVDIYKTENTKLKMKTADVEFIKAYNEKDKTTDADDERLEKIVKEIEKQMAVPFGWNAKPTDKTVITGVYAKDGDALMEY